MVALANLALAAASVVGAASGTGVLVNQLASNDGVPERAAVAYITAARNAPCPLDYRILTAIGAVESGHGTHGGTHLDASGEEVDASGQPKPAVSSQGAQGPMQFMPATWAQYATDGNGDGKTDVNNIDDAAASSAKLLCSSNVDENVNDAVGSYNGGANWQQYSESQNYVAQVDERVAALPADDGSAAGLSGATQTAAKFPTDKGRICGVAEATSPGNDCLDLARQRAAYLWAQLGQILGKGDTPKLHDLWSKLNGAPPATAAAQTISATKPGPAPTGNLVNLPDDLCARPNGCQLDESWAPSLTAALRQAAKDGYPIVVLSAYRSNAEQSYLYAKNCPTPDCPGGLTAKPGTSNHEGGQATDLERLDGGPLAGAGDPYWQEMKRIGPAFGVLQADDLASSDTPHFSATGR